MDTPRYVVADQCPPYFSNSNLVPQATAELEAESQKLNAIVGVLAAIVVLLVLALLGGAYFLHQKTKKMAQIAEESVMTEAIEANDDKDVDAPMVTGHQTVYTE